MLLVGRMSMYWSLLQMAGIKVLCSCCSATAHSCEKRAWQEHENYRAKLNEVYNSIQGKDQEEVVSIFLKPGLDDDLHDDDLDWNIGD